MWVGVMRQDHISLPLLLPLPPYPSLCLLLTTFLKREKAGEGSPAPVLCQKVGGRAGRSDGRVTVVGVGYCDQDNHRLHPRSHVVVVET